MDLRKEILTGMLRTTGSKMVSTLYVNETCSSDYLEDLSIAENIIKEHIL